MSRPKQEPTKIISIRIDRIKEVERVLKRPIAVKQIPIVKIRVSDWEETIIKEIFNVDD